MARIPSPEDRPDAWHDFEDFTGEDDDEPEPPPEPEEGE